MQYLKSFEQFKIEQDEMSEKMRLFGSDPEKKKQELNKLLEPYKEKSPTFYKLFDTMLKTDKLTPARMLDIVKRVFGGDEFYKKYSWLVNKSKFQIFKETAEKALTENSDEAWEKLLGLLNFGMKYSTSIAAFPVWDETNKKWDSGSLPGKQMNA